MSKYICVFCGYEYDEDVGDHECGIPPTKFDDLPEFWECPNCSLDKTCFILSTIASGINTS